IRRLRVADDVGPHVQRVWKLRPDERAGGGGKCGRAEEQHRANERRRCGLDHLHGRVATATICQPKGYPGRLKRKSRSKADIAAAAVGLFPCRSRVTRRPRAITVNRYRLKNGNPARCARSTSSPDSASRPVRVEGVKWRRWPMLRSKADIGPPGTVTMTRQPGAR